MDFNQLATEMSEDVYQQLKLAIEIGRWPDGRKLNDQQKKICIEAVLRYEQEHLPPEQRTGYITPKKSSSENSSCDQEQTLRWQD